MRHEKNFGYNCNFFRSPKAFFGQIFKISLKREFMTGLILALENMPNFRLLN